MKILIDARMYGLEHAGIGRYVENLIGQLQVVDKENEYVLLMRRPQITNHKSQILNNPQILNTKYKILETDIPHYSLAEQTKLPKLLNKLDFNLAHFPHFNVPVFFRKPFVVTIHDLIKHTSRGMQTTTRNPLLYWAKYAGYKTVFGNAVARAKRIIVPSEVVKKDLLENYKIPAGKIEVIYEGVDEAYLKTEKQKNLKTILEKYKVMQPYVIYTGSAYPHKNLERLIEAQKILITNHQPPTTLVIVSARNVFLGRLQKVVENQGMQENVKFLGFIKDSELAALYRSATAFIFPSLSEGFGLPGLEAMAAGCPVVCSDIPVFHEIYADAAVYFRPTDATDIADKIQMILSDGKVREDMGSKGKEQASKYSWRKMAEETLGVYKEALSLFL